MDKQDIIDQVLADPQVQEIKKEIDLLKGAEFQKIFSDIVDRLIGFYASKNPVVATIVALAKAELLTWLGHYTTTHKTHCHFGEFLERVFGGHKAVKAS